MTTLAPPPVPAKRSKRMIVWLVIAPIVLLLLAFAGANWKTFHLAYCKRLMRSSNPDTKYRGLSTMAEVHFTKGMSRQEVSRLLSPLKVYSMDKSRSMCYAGFDRPDEGPCGLWLDFDGGTYLGHSVFNRL